MTEVPATADEAAAIQQALLGTCDVVALQKGDGPVQDDSGLALIFGQSGAAGYDALGIKLNYTYRLEGRNIITTGPLETLRVDDWSSRTLKLFEYARSWTYYCKKR